jgi:hypothetical protein
MNCSDRWTDRQKHRQTDRHREGEKLFCFVYKKNAAFDTLPFLQPGMNEIHKFKK